MATIKSEYYRFNGTGWDLMYFKTSADLVVETTNYKVMTAGERNKIITYLTSFNAANKLAFIESGGKLPVGIIPSLNYLPLSGGTVTGGITVDGIAQFENNSIFQDVYMNGTIGSDTDSLRFDVSIIDFGGALLRNIETPLIGTDAVNKEYVDNLVSAGFKVKDPVKAASTANVNTATALNALDGYNLAAGDRVLLKNQSTASQNGVYLLNASKIPQKVADDSTVGCAVFIENGSTNNDHIYVCRAENTWAIFTKPDTILAGSGLTKNGNTISIPTNGVKSTMIDSVHPVRIEDFAVLEDYTSWSEIANTGTLLGLRSNLEHIKSAIKILRGTASYNTNNNQTIAGAYALANSKIKSEIGAAVPGTSGYNAGDIFFKTLS